MRHRGPGARRSGPTDDAERPGQPVAHRSPRHVSHPIAVASSTGSPTGCSATWERRGRRKAMYGLTRGMFTLIGAAGVGSCSGWRRNSTSARPASTGPGSACSRRAGSRLRCRSCSAAGRSGGGRGSREASSARLPARVRRRSARAAARAAQFGCRWNRLGGGHWAQRGGRRSLGDRPGGNRVGLGLAFGLTFDTTGPRVRAIGTTSHSRWTSLPPPSPWRADTTWQSPPAPART